ncbi:MAG: copper chaperone PCu(A)C [Anaerolineales bacterium]|nr:copper chaperone PCu(A)C [Anaerolineales bacterium]
MKKFIAMIFVAAILLTACSGGGGTGVEAAGYWMRSGLKDGNSAAYMMLHNYTGQDVALVGASSDAASAVEVHLSQMDANGVMEMIQQESVAIPAKGELELKPGSYHIMFIGLKNDLNAGDQITLTLHFDGYDDMTLTVPVQDAADSSGGMEGMDMGGDDSMQMDMNATPTP